MRAKLLLPFCVLMTSALLAMACGDSEVASDAATPRGQDVSEADAGVTSVSDVADGTQRQGVSQVDLGDALDGAQGPDDVDDASAADGVAEPVNKPLIVQEELTPLSLDGWFVTGISNSDGVGDALDAGTFVSPSEPGVDAQGHYWSAAPSDESGSISGGGQYFYAATTIESDGAQGLVVRAGRLYNVWLNGVRLPADVYKSGKHRLPFRLKDGANSLVVQGGGGADALVQTFTTDAEVYVNWSDAITPHLIVDRVDPELYVGAALLNLTERPLSNL